MATAIYWSFQKGFITYLTELDRLDETVADLSATYRIVGSWDFLRGNHEGEISAQASRLGGIRIHIKLPAEINNHE
jgi:hypothetical protein